MMMCDFKILKLTDFSNLLSLARPSAPRNCSLQTGNTSADGTNSWLRVRCVAGYDGGLPQSFMLEALDPITGKTKYNGSVNETGKYCRDETVAVAKAYKAVYFFKTVNKPTFIWLFNQMYVFK